MKKSILILILAVGLLGPQLVPAQGTLYVSNLGQTPTGGAAIGSDSWIAQTFFTGTNSPGYILNSVQLLMDAASGSPGVFTVSLYSKTGDPHSFQSPGDSPQSGLGSLNGSDPAAGGLFTYTASGLTLSPSTVYFFAVTATIPVAQGAYHWSAANDITQGGNNWIIDDSYFSSANGSSWTETVRQDVFQMAIIATAIPEPPAISLVFLGSGVFLYARRIKTYSRI